MEVDQSSFTSAPWNNDLGRIMSRPSWFATQDFEADPDLMNMLHNDANVLVIGAGGLGCEILKNLALSGINHITVIDLDTIDLTNLNRQFLFRMKDVGRYKAEVAAEVVMTRCPGVKIEWKKQYVQEFDDEFFKQFQVIIGGVDNVEARRWLNSMVHSLVEFDKEGNAEVGTFLIDGGTEGFNGQSRVIEPFTDACYECMMDTLPPETTFNFCTVKNIPRQPEHCIQYVMIMEWNEHHPDRAMDKDSPEDMMWVCERAQARAAEFNIAGVDYKLTMGVTKNIIPAIASTNALVSALCVNECVKILTGCNFKLKNSSYSFGQTGINISQQDDARLENCLVCSRQAQAYTVAKSQMLKDFVEEIKEKLKLNGPMIQHGNTVLCGTGFLAKGMDFKLDLTWEQLVAQGHFDPSKEYQVIDKKIPSEIILKITIE